MPSTIKTIDLFACNVGLTDKRGKSYASEVAALLKQDPQYQHIQLHAFTVNASAYSREVISVVKESGQTFVFGVKKENESAYQQKNEEIATIRGTLKLIGDRIEEAESMLTKYPNSRTVKESSEKRIADLTQQLAETTQKLQEARNARFNLREKLATYDNYCEALDNKPEYHIQPYEPQANTANKKRLLSPSPQPKKGTSEEENSTVAVSSPDRKQAKLEEASLLAPAEQSRRATATVASSSSTSNAQNTVEYSLEDVSLQNYRAKERLYTQKISAIGQQLRESYLPKMVSSSETSALPTQARAC